VRGPWSSALVASLALSCHRPEKAPAPSVVEASLPVVSMPSSRPPQDDVHAIAISPPFDDPPTSHFDRVAELPSFYDARGVDGRLTVARCGGVRILDTDLHRGRDVSLDVPAGGCVALLGAVGKTLVVHVDGRGLFGIDVETGETRWSAPIHVSAPCHHATQQASFASAHTCQWIALSGHTVVSSEASGKLVGRSVEGGEVQWEESHDAFGKESRVVADGAAHVMSVLTDRQTVQSFDAATGAVLWEKRFKHDDLFQLPIWGLKEGLFLEPPGLLPVLLDGATGTERGSSKLVGEAGFAGTTPLRVGRGEAAFDERSLFATDEHGRLVAYRRDRGEREWSYGILAIGPVSLEPTWAQPRVEWVGATEVLVGLGVANDGAPVLSLFRKGPSPLASKRIHVRGRVLDPGMGSGEDILLGPSRVDVHPTKGGGEFEADVEGRGSLRVSFAAGDTPATHVTPPSAELPFETGAVVDLRFRVVDNGHHENQLGLPEP
jgi:hypothetical protein